MRFPAASRLRFLGLALFVLAHSATPLAHANTRRVVIKIPGVRFQSAARPSVPRHATSLENTHSLGQGKALDIIVRGRGIAFLRQTGVITLRGNTLEVNGTPKKVETGDEISVAGRTFEVLNFDPAAGRLELRRVGWFGARREALVLQTKNPVTQTPTLDYMETDRLRYYNGRLWRRAWNWVPLANRLSFASHNPIQQEIGSRLRKGGSPLLRVSFFGKQTPDGLATRISTGPLWADLGKFYAAIDKSHLGQGPLGTIELDFADGTWLRDRPEVGRVKHANPKWLRFLLGDAAAHTRVISIGRQLKPGHGDWMRLSTNWLIGKTDVRFAGGYSN